MNILDSAAPSEILLDIDFDEVMLLAIILSIVVAITILVIIKLINKKNSNK